MAKPHIIIDGYNFIMRLYKIDWDQDDALLEARERLIHQLIAYRGNKQMEITIVFDGQDVKGIMKKHRPKGIHVRFSRAPQKADPMILKMIHAAKNPGSITLVTSDRGLSRQAKAYGCRGESVESFRDRIEAKPQPKSHGAEKKYNVNMSQQELKEWLRLFDEGKE